MKTRDDFELEPWAIGMRPDDANFVREFMLDLNAYQAMLRCGFPASTAKSDGWRVIRRPAIAKAIAAAMSERAEALGINAKLVLSETYRCYLASVEDRNWTAAKGFLEMMGKHVDVQAFRTQVGLSDPDGEPLEINLSGMSTDEKRAALMLVERLAGSQSASLDEGASSLH